MQYELAMTNIWFCKHIKTTLPENSLLIKERLDAIIQEILAVAKDPVAMMIFFGSYGFKYIIYTRKSQLNLL